MNLRDYQARAIDEARACFASGKRAPLIVAPTGSGKTVIGTGIAHYANAKGRNVLWIAHRQELLDQAWCASDHWGSNGSDAFQTMTIQSLRNNRPLNIGLVIIDEAHHYAADQWSEFLGTYRDVPRVGMTATPQRGDGRGLGDNFDAMIVAATPSELLERELLVPCEIHRAPRLLGPGEVAQQPLSAWQRHARGKRTIVFCQDVAHATDVTMSFRQAGVGAVCITGQTAKLQRDEIYSQFRNGERTVLVSVNVLTEGFDAPETECCIIARGCSTAAGYLQMVGRVLRPAHGKKSAVLLDLRGVSHIHGSPYDERSYSLAGIGIRRKGSSDDFRFCQVCSALLEDTATGCDHCGWERGASDRHVRSLAIALEKYATKRAEPESERIATYERWVVEGQIKGYKPGWARAKYTAVYNQQPPAKRTVHGERHHKSKLCEEDVRAIREMYESGGYKKTELGKLFRVTDVNIGEIVAYRTWKEVYGSFT